jgi:hypothetical protein
MTTWAARRTALALGLLVAASPVGAQQVGPGRIDDPVPPTGLRTTPLRQPRGLAVGPGGGFFIEPTIAAFTLRDENLFFQPGDDTVGDWIARVSPALQAGYRGERGVGVAWYTFDAERYQDHPELNRGRVRDSGGVDVTATATERLTIAVSAGHAYTTTPYELASTTVFTIGRVRAERLAVNPSAIYAHTPRTSTRVEYAFTNDQLTGGTRIRTQIATGELRHGTLGGRATLLGTYILRDFAFDAGRLNPSHVVGGGVQYALSPRTDVTARAGVRLTPGGLSQIRPDEELPPLVSNPFPALIDTDFSVTPEWNVALRQRGAQYEVAATFLRTQATAIGLTGVVDTTSAGAEAVVRPSRWFELRANPTFSRDVLGPTDARAWRVSVDANSWIGSRTAIVASWRYALQQGRVGVFTLPGTEPPGDIRMQSVQVGVLVTAARRAAIGAGGGARGSRP